MRRQASVMHEYKALMQGPQEEPGKEKLTASTAHSLLSLVQSRRRLNAENHRYRSTGNIRRVNSHYFQTLFSKSKAPTKTENPSGADREKQSTTGTSWFGDPGNLRLSKVEIVGSD